MLERTFTFWRNMVGKTAESRQETQNTAVEDDRRLWMRYTTDFEGSVQLPEKNQEEKILVRVRDLSLGGANLHVDRPLKSGQMISLELHVDQEIRTVLACVVRVSPLNNGNWSLGCVFARELSNADLLKFGARKLEAAREDQRTWVRFAGGLKANYRKVGEPVGVTHPAKVLNIAATGIGLAVHPSLQTGSLLNVDLMDKDGRMVRTILACVVHTTQRAVGDYAVGCNFIRELTEDELQSLL